MTKKVVIEKVTNLVAPVVFEMGYELWNVDYYKDPVGYNLLIEIDRAGGISFDDLVPINTKINALLDEADLIKDSYCLEVSSAGLERELKKPHHIQKFVGSDSKITVKLYAPRDGSKQFEGKLAEYDGEKITLDCDGDRKVFPLKDVASIKAELNITEDLSE